MLRLRTQVVGDFNGRVQGLCPAHSEEAPGMNKGCRIRQGIDGREGTEPRPIPSKPIRGSSRPWRQRPVLGPRILGLPFLGRWFPSRETEEPGAPGEGCGHQPGFKQSALGSRSSSHAASGWQRGRPSSSSRRIGTWDGASMATRTTPGLMAATWIVTWRLGRTIFWCRRRDRTNTARTPCHGACRGDGKGEPSLALEKFPTRRRHFFYKRKPPESKGTFAKSATSVVPSRWPAVLRDLLVLVATVTGGRRFKFAGVVGRAQSGDMPLPGKAVELMANLLRAPGPACSVKKTQFLSQRLCFKQEETGGR